MRKMIIYKKQVVENNDNKDSIISMEEYFAYITEYGEKVSATTRSARKYLRKIGMIDEKCNFIKRQK